MTDLWSCGGGTQSAAIAALIVRGDIRKPDLAVIVDTERERESTWQYYDSVLKPALASVGVDLVRVKKSEYSHVDLYGGADDDTLLIPAYYDGGGDRLGKMPGYCSGEWKRNVVRRWARAQGMKCGKLWLGISADEPKRIRVDTGVSWLEPWYPLGPTELRYTRRMCVSLVKSLGWPEPPRSSCYMCPNSGDAEWKRMRQEHPNDFQRACEFDCTMRETTPNVFLHRSGVPLAQVDFSDSQMTFGDMCAGMCFV